MPSQINIYQSSRLVKSILRLRLKSVVCIFLVTTMAVVSFSPFSCSSGSNVTLGQNNAGTISKSDPSEGKTANNRWSYHVYYLNVEAGQPYKFTLTSKSGVTTGIWSSDKGGWIVEVSPIVHTRAATYTFTKGGKQKLLIEVPSTEVPAEYSWYVTR